MRCPNCKDIDLVETMTRQGVLVDYCPRCEGVWLDKGEIYYFTKAPTYLRSNIEEALKNPKTSERVDPHTGQPLLELSLFKGKLVIDYSPQTQGIWLDKGEINKLPGSKDIKLGMDLDRGKAREKKTQISLPNLGLVSGITLFLLYSLLTLILVVCVNFGWLSAGAALLLGVTIAFLHFLLSPFLMDLSLKFFYRVKWVTLDELPQHLRDFISKVTVQQRIKFPRIGIIPDGSPNAFTYGHTPNNARIVITAGLLNLLEPQEVEAVVAHEIGHIVHWDMLAMTIAYLVPLVFYYIYITLIKGGSRDRDKSAPYRDAIAIGSYILYFISEYIVLWFSRIREYFADRFSGETTNSPETLASALVKIGYGLAGREKKKEERRPQLEGIKAMGIFDPNSARALAVSSYTPAVSMGQDIDKEKLKGAMRWDLWNPWGLYYELNSTHPLVAKRLLALSRQAESIGKEPYIRFEERRPESYWDEFFVDLLMVFLPFFVVLGSIFLSIINRSFFFLKFGLFLFGVAYLLKVIFSYDFSHFPEMNISSLLKKIKVSAIRPVPCVVKGKIIGRGIPGLIWSEDFVLQDETGIIFLDYRQPLNIWNFLFGLLRAKRYIGEEVKITGWYRRSPIPYIEIKTLETKSGRSTCFVFNVKVIFSVFLIIIGLFLLFF